MGLGINKQGNDIMSGSEQYSMRVRVKVTASDHRQRERRAVAHQMGTFPEDSLRLLRCSNLAQ